MPTIPAPFVALQAAVDGLDAFLKIQVFDLTPIISTQPPSNRDAHRELIGAAIEALGAQLATIQQLHERIVEVRDVIVRRRSMAHSALQPISAIPSEVVRIVFSWMCDPEEGDTALAITLSHVCARWREVIRGHRRFWKATTIAGTGDLLQLALPLSLCGQQDFHLTVANRGKQGLPGAISSLKDSLRQHLSKLEWKSSEDPNRFLSLMRQQQGVTCFPSLRHIVLSASCCIEGKSGFKTDFKVNLRRISFPSLTHLELSNNTSLAHTGTIMHHLKNLVLSDMNMSFQAFRVLLRGATCLESLCLCDVQRMYDAPSEFSWEEEIELLSLQSLEMREVEDSVASSVLGFCRFPALQFLCVENVEDLEYSEQIGTPWHHVASDDPDFRRGTLPNALYKAIVSTSPLGLIALHLPHYAIRAAIHALLPIPGWTLPAEPLNHLHLRVTDPLSEHGLNEPRSSLRVAHTQAIADGVGELLLETLRQRARFSASLRSLCVSSCLGGKSRFGQWVQWVDVRKCECPIDHSGWLVDHDSEQVDTEGDGEEEEDG